SGSRAKTAVSQTSRTAQTSQTAKRLLGCRRDLFVDRQCAAVVVDETFWSDVLAAGDLLFDTRDEPLGFFAAREKRFSGNAKMPRPSSGKAEAITRPLFKPTPSEPRRGLELEPRRNLRLV